MKKNHSASLAQFLVLIISASVFISSCKKNTGPPEPVIILTSPSDTVSINVGDTILIKGTVSDNKSLHELYFTFGNISNDSVFFSDHPYVHGAKNYNFSYIWYPSISAVYKFTVNAEDHDGNTTSKDFLLTVN